MHSICRITDWHSISTLYEYRLCPPWYPDPFPFINTFSQFFLEFHYNLVKLRVFMYIKKFNFQKLISPLRKFIRINKKFTNHFHKKRVRMTDHLLSNYFFCRLVSNFFELILCRILHNIMQYNATASLLSAFHALDYFPRFLSDRELIELSSATHCTVPSSRTRFHVCIANSPICL